MSPTSSWLRAALLAAVAVAASEAARNNRRFGESSLIQKRARIGTVAVAGADPELPGDPRRGADSSLAVRSFASADGHNATVLLDYGGRSHEFRLEAWSVYAPEAYVAKLTSGGLEQGLPPVGRKTFASRADGSWASARLHSDGTVSGLFQVGSLALRVARGGTAIALLQRPGDAGSSSISHHSSVRPLASLLALGDGMQQGPGARIVGSVGGSPVEIVVDSVPEADPDHLLYPSGRPLPDFELALSRTGWGGTRFFPGCYAGDSELHVLTVGFTADYEAYRVYGSQLQAMLEDILTEASFVYEMQMNMRLKIGYMMIHETQAGAPGYAVGCGDMQVDKLRPFMADKPSATVGAHHLFTGCGPPYGVVGIAAVGTVCQTSNVGVTKLRGDGTFDTYAHELGHNLGAHHSFEEGQGQTGGIMDYDGGLVGGVYQFNAKYRRGEMCSTLSRARSSTCQVGQFEAVGSGTSATTTPTPAVSPSARCADGFLLRPVATSACPPNPDLGPCDTVVAGELCEGDGECGTDTGLDNCQGAYDVYRKGTGSGQPAHSTSVAQTSRTVSTTTQLASAAQCADGFPLMPVAAADCPADPNIARCDAVAAGAMCEGDGECRTNAALDNCGAYDVYRKGTTPGQPGQPASTSPPPAPTLACSDGLPLVPVATTNCPANPELARCDTVTAGELCEGDGECQTDTRLDNCAGGYDVYRKGGVPGQTSPPSQPSSTTSTFGMPQVSCSDGLTLIPVAAFDCPADPDIARCDAVSAGQLCEGDGECNTDSRLDNCGGAYDVYRKGTATVMPTAAPTVTTSPPTVPGKLACADGLELTPVASADCPADPNIQRCDAVASGELCEGDGECGTDASLDNCGGAYDVYRKAGFGGASTTATVATTPAGVGGVPSEASAVAWEHWRLLNELRAVGGTCPDGRSHSPNPVPLIFDCRLWRASLLHSKDMAEGGYFSHTSQDGRLPWDRAAEQGVVASGENIAAGYASAGDTLRQWKESNGHCNNMMSSGFKVGAVGYWAGGRYGHYWTQMFAGSDDGSLDTACYPSAAGIAVHVVPAPGVDATSGGVIGHAWKSAPGAAEPDADVPGVVGVAWTDGNA